MRMAETEPIRPIPCPLAQKNIVFTVIIKQQAKRLGFRIIPVCYFIEEIGVALERICIISLLASYKFQIDKTEINRFFRIIFFLCLFREDRLHQCLWTDDGQTCRLSALRMCLENQRASCFDRHLMQ